MPESGTRQSRPLRPGLVDLGEGDETGYGSMPGGSAKSRCDPAAALKSRLSPSGASGRDAVTRGCAAPYATGWPCQGTGGSGRELRLTACAIDALGGEALRHIAIVVDAAIDEAVVAVGQMRAQGAAADAEALDALAAVGEVADGNQVCRGSAAGLAGAPSPLPGRALRCGLGDGPTGEDRRHRPQHAHRAADGVKRPYACG